MPEDLNKIRINLGELRRHLSDLNKDFDEIGLHDLLIFINVYYHSEETVKFMPGVGGTLVPQVSPKRSPKRT
jgi:hypothetical protein